MTESQTTPLSVPELFVHVEQRIAERANLRHLYQIEDDEDGPVAVMHASAAASLWRVVREAITEAGWKLTVRSDP